MNADQDDAIRAEHTFFERSKIDKKKALFARQSPDLNEMYGARITERLQYGGEKIHLFYWTTRERRNECLPRIKSRYLNPIIIKLIRK
jgi:hypothetical protein